jgi:hypothetical protein
MPRPSEPDRLKSRSRRAFRLSSNGSNSLLTDATCAPSKTSFPVWPHHPSESASSATATLTVNSQIVTAFDLWFPRTTGSAFSGPRPFRLSLDYFDSLMRHAVPLDERAIAALSHSAMALDIYAWLAQRLHRVDPKRPALIPWPALREQFGWHYDRLRDFKRAIASAPSAVSTRAHVST